MERRKTVKAVVNNCNVLMLKYVLHYVKQYITALGYNFVHDDTECDYYLFCNYFKGCLQLELCDKRMNRKAFKIVSEKELIEL